MKREDRWLCQTVKRKKSKKDGKYTFYREALESKMNPDSHTVALTEEMYRKWVVGVYGDMVGDNRAFAQEMMYQMYVNGAIMGDKNE